MGEFNLLSSRHQYSVVMCVLIYINLLARNIRPRLDNKTETFSGAFSISKSAKSSQAQEIRESNKGLTNLIRFIISSHETTVLGAF